MKEVDTGMNIPDGCSLNACGYGFILLWTYKQSVESSVKLLTHYSVSKDASSFLTRYTKISILMGPVNQAICADLSLHLITNEEHSSKRRDLWDFFQKIKRRQITLKINGLKRKLRAQTGNLISQSINNHFSKIYLG